MCTRYYYLGTSERSWSRGNEWVSAPPRPHKVLLPYTSRDTALAIIMGTKAAHLIKWQDGLNQAPPTCQIKFSVPVELDVGQPSLENLHVFLASQAQMLYHPLNPWRSFHTIFSPSSLQRKSSPSSTARNWIAKSLELLYFSFLSQSLSGLPVPPFCLWPMRFLAGLLSSTPSRNHFSLWLPEGISPCVHSTDSGSFSCFFSMHSMSLNTKLPGIYSTQRFFPSCCFFCLFEKEVRVFLLSSLFLIG